MRPASPITSTVLSVILSACISAATPLASAREWTDATGRFRVEAEFVGQEDGHVRLKKPDGKTVQVLIARLSQADREYVQQQTVQPQAAPKPANAAPEPVAGAPPILHTLAGHRGKIGGLAFSADGWQLASTSDNEKSVRIWDGQRGTQLRTFEHGKERGTLAASIRPAFSPDGRYLTAACYRAFVVCWDLKTGAVVFDDVMAGRHLGSGVPQASRGNTRQRP